MSENDDRESARPVNSEPIFVMGQVLTTEQVNLRLGKSKDNKHRWKRWREAGLRPLEFFTNGDHWLSDEIIEMGIRCRVDEPPPPDPPPKPKRKK